MKRLLILGSTGSIGTQALDVVARAPDELERLRRARDDVERLRADGAGRAEDQEPLHPPTQSGRARLSGG